ncbi:hypothetical protein M3Y99_01655300 [Aphelenchoides fujianensis]|nr:hypothetical protein M3Y99_01655300 [Aphelenchoides fujianensis]
MTRVAQTKAEKQMIDAKVAKVREVVHNVSKNDIVLALHNFEMDVDRTIGAFVDGGEQAPKNAAVTNAKLSNGTDIKHSVSQTSLVSSVGEDSGLGQISPVYQDKHATPVADSGLLQSDGLSADQLADLQAIFQQNLQAQGINADVLAGIIGDSDAANSAGRRRNAPRRDGGGPAGGAKPKQQNGKSGKPVKAGH